MTARYRIIEEKGAYMPRTSSPQLLQLGADHQAARVYGITAVICEMLPEGTEIEFDGVPGPHLEPLNDEAREAMAKYRKANPNATLDPTRHMPLGQDPMAGQSFEQAVLGRLDHQLAAARVRDETDPRLEALLAGNRDIQALLAVLVPLVAQQAAQSAAPQGHKGGRP